MGGRAQLVNVLDQLRPVGNGQGEIAQEDKVERVAVHPARLDIVDLELDVDGDKVILDGADVVPQHLIIVPNRSASLKA